MPFGREDKIAKRMGNCCEIGPGFVVSSLITRDSFGSFAAFCIDIEGLIDVNTRLESIGQVCHISLICFAQHDRLKRVFSSNQ